MKMKLLSSYVYIVGIAIACLAASSARAELLVDFNELNGYTTSGPNGSYFDGYGSGASMGTWQSQGVTFNTGTFGPGWSYSDVNNPTTAGFGNQWAASPGTGVGGSGNYVIGTTFDPNAAFFNLPVGHRVNSLFVTNTTYAAQSMLNGDGFAKKFGGTTGNDPDFFRVTVTGFETVNVAGSTTGSVEYFLADYRFADNSLDHVVTNWRLLDLTGLGAARSIGIRFDGTDNDPVFGLNTPAYVAIDNLSLTAVPEPSTLLLLSIGVAVAFTRRVRSNHKKVS
jgi:Domain of unknown function (DUF4465)/PEP-CTERM motif